LAMREGSQTAVSMHMMFLSDQMAYRCVIRVDGQPLDAAPITPYQSGATTKSPFVCIAAR